MVALAGVVLIVLVLGLALWAGRRQRRLYPRDRPRVEDPGSPGFSGVGVVEKFRDEE